MLELKNLSKVFDNGVERITAVKPTNLKINDGEFVIIVGGNGTGKSTLLNLICGDVKQTTGQIFIDNNNVTNLLRQDRAKYISYIFQDPSASVCPDMTIAENFAIANARVKNRGLKFGITKKDIILFKERLAEFNLDLEKRLNQKVSLLSGGQKQIVALLMATLNSPKLLLLDEHTSALDPKIAKQVMEITHDLVRKHKTTTMMITHNLNHAINYGNRLLYLRGGEVVLDVSGAEKQALTPASLVTQFI